MANWYTDINDIAVAGVGNKTSPFNIAQLELFVEGAVVAGHSLANGDIIYAKGASTVAGETFLNCAVSFTLKGWDNEPYFLDDVLLYAYVQFGITIAASPLTVYINDAIISHIFISREGGPVNGTFYFRNCATYIIGAYLIDFITQYNLYFQCCSFLNLTGGCDRGTGTSIVSFEHCVGQNVQFFIDAGGAFPWGAGVVNECIFDNAQNTAFPPVVPPDTLAITDTTFNALIARTYPTYAQALTAFNAGTFRSLVEYIDYKLPGPWPFPSNWDTDDLSFGWYDDVRFGYGAFCFKISANANPQFGTAPLKVEFTVDNLSFPPDAFSWNFGDGTVGSEANPVHTYNMPGEYDVTLTIIVSGKTITWTTIIYVYENDYSAGGRVVTKTDKCYRFAIPQEQITQGNGWTEYNGDKWPFPVGLVGCSKIMDENDEDIQLCVDGDTFYTYQLGKDDWWVDGGNEDYAGDDFEAEILLRENVNPIGATSRIKHSQSRADFKPWWKDQRKTGVYNAQGFRDAFSADLFVRKDSEPYNAAITKQIPRKGQVVFDRNMESEFLQMGLKVRGAPWRMTYAEQWYASRDSGGNPDLKEMSELKWALLATEPLVWIGRDSGLVVPTLPINYGTGLQVTGSYTALITGPDGYENSAFSFGIADSFVARSIPDAGQNFSLMMWIRSPANPVVLWESTEGGLRVVLTAVGAGWKIEYTDNHNSFDIPLNDISGWTMLTLVRKDDFLVAYQNGTLLNTYGLVADMDNVFGDITVCQGSCAAWVMRMVPGILSSQAVEYFYNDVIENKGNATENIF